MDTTCISKFKIFLFVFLFSVVINAQSDISKSNDTVYIYDSSISGLGLVVEEDLIIDTDEKEHSLLFILIGALSLLSLGLIAFSFYLWKRCSSHRKRIHDINLDIKDLEFELETLKKQMYNSGKTR